MQKVHDVLSGLFHQGMSQKLAELWRVGLHEARETADTLRPQVVTHCTTVAISTTMGATQGLEDPGYENTAFTFNVINIVI